MRQASCSCGATWREYFACHCAGCHATFGSLAAFDRHRRQGQCLEPAAVSDAEGTAVFATDKKGYWILPMSDEQRQRLKHLRDKG